MRELEEGEKTRCNPSRESADKSTYGWGQQRGLQYTVS